MNYISLIGWERLASRKNPRLLLDICSTRVAAYVSSFCCTPQSTFQVRLLFYLFMSIIQYELNHLFKVFKY